MHEDNDLEAGSQKDEKSSDENRGSKRGKYLKPLEGTLALPYSTYDTVVSIIRALYHIARDDPATLNNIATSAGVGRTLVSQNNSFLQSLGIVSKLKKRFVLTEKGSTLGLALDYDNSEDIAEAWRALVSESEFLQRMLSAVDIKGGMKENELAAYISKSTGLPHKKRFTRGANTVIDVLVASGLSAKMEDGVVNVTPEYSQLKLGVKKPTKIGKTEKIRIQDRVSTEVLRGSKEVPSNFVVNLNISFSADTTDDEVDEIARKIRRLSESIARE